MLIHPLCFELKPAFIPQISRTVRLLDSWLDRMESRFSQVLEETEHFCGCGQEEVERGRTASYLAAPAQIPACGFPAPGSS
jgi:predicted RNA-binding Zn-ribbon protein involved in translation (DUF1610 family)